MATIDRIEPAYMPWSPSASGFATEDVAADDYIGKHRKADSRRWALHKLFYVAKHVRR